MKPYPKLENFSVASAIAVTFPSILRQLIEHWLNVQFSMDQIDDLHRVQSITKIKFKKMKSVYTQKNY